MAAMILMELSRLHASRTLLASQASSRRPRRLVMYTFRESSGSVERESGYGLRNTYPHSSLARTSPNAILSTSNIAVKKKLDFKDPGS